MFARGLLFRYLFSHFLKYLLLVGAIFFAIMFLGEYLEAARRASETDQVQVVEAFLLALYNVPLRLLEIIPFIILFSVVGTLLSLNRRSEIMVMRASGLSIWQIISPALFCSFIVGLIAIFVLDPLAGSLSFRADKVWKKVVITPFKLNEHKKWFQQVEKDKGVTFIRVNKIVNNETLENVLVLRVDKNGYFSYRINSKRAVRKNDKWYFENGLFFNQAGYIDDFKSREANFDFSVGSLTTFLLDATYVPIWRLNEYYHIAKLKGGNIGKYLTKKHILISYPLLLCAMVLMGTLVVFHSFRNGSAGLVIFISIGVGFVFYVLMRLIAEFGAFGIIAPYIAGWALPIIGLMLGSILISYKEHK